MGKIKIFTISLLTMTVNPKVHSVIKILKTRETFTIKINTYGLAQIKDFTAINLNWIS